MQNWAHVTIIGKEQLCARRITEQGTTSHFAFHKIAAWRTREANSRFSCFFENETCGLIFGVCSVVRI